jgi:hypothetical protein
MTLLHASTIQCRESPCPDHDMISRLIDDFLEHVQASSVNQPSRCPACTDSHLTSTNTRHAAAPTPLISAILQVYNVEVVRADDIASRTLDRSNRSLYPCISNSVKSVRSWRIVLVHLHHTLDTVPATRSRPLPRKHPSVTVPVLPVDLTAHDHCTGSSITVSLSSVYSVVLL